MTETVKLRITGMHCDSCEKLLKSRISKIANVKDVKLTYTNDIAEVSYDNKLDTNEIIKTVQNSGYDAKVVNGDETHEETTFKHYVKDLKAKEKIEGNLIKWSVILLLVLALTEIIAYYGFFRNIPDFFSKFGYYLIFLVISITISAIAVWHIKAYGNLFSCMTGMMIGMTIGMISGFLIGLIVGSTNGMFIGTLAGLFVGIPVGVWCGSCCGVMGSMEGMMAGFMGGLMGAMTAIMMINDNLKIITPILVGISIIIIVGLDYMIYKEIRNNKHNVPKPNNLFTLITLCFITTIILTWLMVYGPKSILFR